MILDIINHVLITFSVIAFFIILAVVAYRFDAVYSDLGKTYAQNFCCCMFTLALGAAVATVIMASAAAGHALRPDLVTGVVPNPGAMHNFDVYASWLAILPPLWGIERALKDWKKVLAKEPIYPVNIAGYLTYLALLFYTLEVAVTTA